MILVMSSSSVNSQAPAVQAARSSPTGSILSARPYLSASQSNSGLSEIQNLSRTTTKVPPYSESRFSKGVGDYTERHLVGPAKAAG